MRAELERLNHEFDKRRPPALYGKPSKKVKLNDSNEHYIPVNHDASSTKKPKSKLNIDKEDNKNTVNRDSEVFELKHAGESIAINNISKNTTKALEKLRDMISEKDMPNFFNAIKNLSEKSKLLKFFCTTLNASTEYLTKLIKKIQENTLITLLGNISNLCEECGIGLSSVANMLSGRGVPDKDDLVYLRQVTRAIGSPYSALLLVRLMMNIKIPILLHKESDCDVHSAFQKYCISDVTKNKSMIQIVCSFLIDTFQNTEINKNDVINKLINMIMISSDHKRSVRISPDQDVPVELNLEDRNSIASEGILGNRLSDIMDLLYNDPIHDTYCEPGDEYFSQENNDGIVPPLENIYSRLYPSDGGHRSPIHQGYDEFFEYLEANNPLAIPQASPNIPRNFDNDLYSLHMPSPDPNNHHLSRGSN